MATTTLDFTLPEGGAATAICTDIGSELMHLSTAIEQLKKFIATAEWTPLSPRATDRPILCHQDRYRLNPIEVSFMYTFFTASDLLPTKWSTADDKAAFGNTLLHFMLTGFLAGRFTEKLYTRLSMCFGFIACFDRQGFSETWFDSPESIASFVNHLMQWPCHGDPGYTFSDVERAVQREAARLNLVAKVNEAAASSIQLRELALLDVLENKYRRDTVIPMPTPAEREELAEQLPLIA